MQERHPVRAPRQQRGLIISYRALAGVLGALAAAGIVILILWQVGVIFSGSKKAATATGPVPSIHFQYPKSWKPLPASRWASVGAPSNAAAVLQRRGNSGNLVVLRARKETVTAKTAQTINDQLRAKFKDYKFVSAKRVQLPNIPSPVMLFTYGRKTQGVLHSITIIPAPPISFVVETASPPNNKPIEKEIGNILRSATLTYPSK
jgi:hypothetical protein